MNFDYSRIGTRSSIVEPVALSELATNIATDWVPRTPSSLSRGFVDLLNSVLESRLPGRHRLWTLRTDVGKFEKQWKQVTSWILGVAFCRKIVELEGYTWWAPVSAFASTTTRWRPSATNWYPSLPHHHCEIIKPTPSLSRLMPDYVLVRLNSTGAYQIGFAESKGTNICLENMGSAKQSWSDQSKNAEFHYKGRLVPSSQNIVVATRVNPKAVHPYTRRIYVRAWNSKNDYDSVPLDLVREILYLHYYGVCMRIGMDANAKLIALSSYSSRHLFPRSEKDYYAEILDSSKNKLYEMANVEIERGEIGQHKETSIYFSKRRSDYISGEMKIRIGLSEPAKMMVNHLQKGVENPLPDDFIISFQKNIESLIGLEKEIPNVFLRNDGIITQLIE